MAERRMFAKTIIDSDAFLDMPLSTQALYFHLSMRADDDGFINNPKKVQRMIGCSEDDLKLLIAKNFVIPFESGIVVIKHWKIHNYIQKDRYKPTVYQEERQGLTIKNNGVYTLDTECIQDGYGLEPQVRLGKDRLGEDSKGEVSIEDVCTESLASSEPETAVDAPALILNDGSEWRPTVNDINEWRNFYTGVDVDRELGRMRQWCLSNPQKRKTKSGARRFVTNWLDKEQNRPSKYSSKQSQKDKYTQRMEAMEGWGRQFESNNQS